MSQSIDIGETNIAANAFTASLPAVNNSSFNPVERTSKVSVYCVSTIVRDEEIGLQIGGVSHGAAMAMLSATLDLSTRDHLILQGVALRGQKIAVSRRDISGTGTTDTAGLVIIEPL